MRYAQEYIQLVVISLELRCQYVESIHEDFQQRFDDWKRVVIGVMIDNSILCSVEDYSALLQLRGISFHLHDWQLRQEKQLGHIYVWRTI